MRSCVMIYFVTTVLQPFILLFQKHLSLFFSKYMFRNEASGKHSQSVCVDTPTRARSTERNRDTQSSGKSPVLPLPIPESVTLSDPLN